ncbi:MAG: hypothetical protein ACREKH_11625, partial [Candidatus Rokuibacteriota bacterium]
MRQGNRFELAVEFDIPDDRRRLVKNGSWAACRYEVAVDVAGPLRLVDETFWLKPAERPLMSPEERQRLREIDPGHVLSPVVHRRRTRSPPG